MSLSGAPLFVLDNASPYIEDYVPSEQSNPMMNRQYNNQQGMYFDQQDMSSDMKMPIMKKKEMIGNDSNEIEHFRGGGGRMGGGMHGGAMNRGGMNRGGMNGMRPMNYSGSGYNRPHHGPHHGGHNRWNNNWNPYYAGAGLAGGYALGNYYDGQNYVDDGYYYDEPPVVQNIYINDDNEKQQQESPIKIESLSSEESSKRKKKLKKFKKVKEELLEEKNNKKEISKQTLYGIIVFLIILVLILGFKLLVDYKMIRF